MPSRAEINEIVAALNTLSKRCQQDLDVLLRGADPTDAEALREALWEVFAPLIERYGDMAAVLASDLAEAQLAEWEKYVRVDPAPGVNAEEALKRMRWAVGTSAPLENMRLIIDQLVKQPFRDTMVQAALVGEVRFARVPVGKTCLFCIMLGSRGDVYATRESAGEINRFHGNCDCQIICVRDKRDYPAGYDPDKLYQQWKAMERGEIPAEYTGPLGSLGNPTPPSVAELLETTSLAAVDDPYKFMSADERAVAEWLFKNQIMTLRSLKERQGDHLRTPEAVTIDLRRTVEIKHAESAGALDGQIRKGRGQSRTLVIQTSLSTAEIQEALERPLSKYGDQLDELIVIAANRRSYVHWIHG